jgi:hypothetical protein
MGNTAFSVKGCVDNFKDEYFEKVLEGVKDEMFQQELRNNIETAKEENTKWVKVQLSDLSKIKNKWPVIYREKYSSMLTDVENKHNEHINHIYKDLHDHLDIGDKMVDDRDKFKRNFDKFIEGMVLGYSDPNFPKHLAELYNLWILDKEIEKFGIVQRMSFDRSIHKGLDGITKGTIKNVEGFKNNDEDIDFKNFLLILVIIVLFLHICSD